MFGFRLILVLAVVGGIIAYIGDKLGSKIGKKRLSIFGLRPHDTSVLLTVLSGVLVAVISVGVLTVASESARTALFGMEELQTKVDMLHTQKKAVESEYLLAMKEVRLKNKDIDMLDKKISKTVAAKKDAERSLQQSLRNYENTKEELLNATGEVENLSKAKEKLKLEVGDLQKKTEMLKAGIYTLREGFVIYRSGEVVFAGVLKAGFSLDESRKQMNWLLEGANAAAENKLGLEEGAGKDIIWIPKAEYLKTLQLLAKAKGDILVRVSALANTVAGQPVLCSLNSIPNKLIYKDRKLIYREEVEYDPRHITADGAFINYLRAVNKKTVEDGVIPDPLTGKVGSINAVSMVEAVKKIKKINGPMVISAYADGNIYAAGPVKMHIEVEKIKKL